MIYSVSRHPDFPSHYRSISMARMVRAIKRQKGDITIERLARIADKYLWTERLFASQITAQALGHSLKRKLDIGRYKYYKSPRLKIGRKTFALVKT